MQIQIHMKREVRVKESMGVRYHCSSCANKGMGRRNDSVGRILEEGALTWTLQQMHLHVP